MSADIQPSGALDAPLENALEGADALRRHEQIHKEPTRSLLEKGGRACVSCAAARRKCSGGSPCSGCAKRSLDCSYPVTSRSRRALSRAKDRRDDVEPRPRVEEEEVSCEASSASVSIPSSPADQDLGQFQESHSVMVGGIAASPSPLPNEQEGNLRELTPRDVGTFSGVGKDSIQLESIINALDPLAGQRFPEDWDQRNITSLNWLPYDWTPDYQLSIGDDFDNPDFRAPPYGQSSQFSPLGFDGESDSQPSPDATLRHYHTLRGLETRDGVDVSSPKSHSTQSTGQYYVDGDGARLPRVRKAPYRPVCQRSLEHASSTGDSIHLLSFPDAGNLPKLDSDPPVFPPEAYNKIKEVFGSTCISTTTHIRFTTATFVSPATLAMFIRLYLGNFQATLPFLHPATFDVVASHWLLLLALATCGSHYLDIDNPNLYSAPMHELLRRALQAVEENTFDDKPDIITLTQAKILTCVGLMYSGEKRMMAIAKTYHHDLVYFCENHWNDPIPEREELPSRSIQTLWRRWCDSESRRRTGYCIWLLDCMWVFHAQMRPMLALEDAKAPIPCQEVLWEAHSALDWHQLYSCSSPSPSLHSVVQLAYIEKRIKSSTGEFSRILCIHALFRRTWEVADYFTQPLALWDPRAERQDISSVEQQAPIWLPGVSIYSKWRNSACDCLDILHWHANSVIGAASGIEHPTVLHLHLARIILLAPYQQIIQLANQMIGQQDGVEIARLTKEVSRWATEDQFKARLAMIHAGVLFWHVRRYSVDAFYEPSSVFLATLALWAYGKFSSHTCGPTANKGDDSMLNRDSDDVNSLYPTAIQLDRPADDELVQHFVKRGINMRANITGVGDLCSRKGHLKVLSQGMSLLLGLNKWGYTKKAIGTLNAFIQKCEFFESD